MQSERVSRSREIRLPFKPMKARGLARSSGQTSDERLLTAGRIAKRTGGKKVLFRRGRDGRARADP